MSKIVNLRQYKVGGAAHIAEERKVKEYSKLWDIEDTTRASLHFSESNSQGAWDQRPSICASSCLI
jgi:hypothetical protein